MQASPELLEATIHALDEAFVLAHPADAVLSRYFRDHPKLGQHDRAFIAETVFAALRRRRLLQHLTGTTDARALMLATLVLVRGLNLREMEQLASPVELEWLAGLKRRAREPLPPEVEWDLPDWVIAKLRETLDDAAIGALAKGLLRTAPLDLRVNLLKTTREEALAALAAGGIAGEATPYSPAGIRINGKPALSQHALFKDGSIEVQDEGSQLVCTLLGPKRGEMVVDFCAGAGGKTLALGMLMRSTGRLYAFDISAKRLAKLKPRQARSGLSNVHPQHIDSERDPRIARLAGKIDRVLVDAPCSGLGTLRRNPDLKWRQKPKDVAELAEKQGRILDSAARLPKPGGRLLYATCSILADENEAVVNAFLARHPEYRLLPAGEELAARGIAIEAQPSKTEAEPYLRLAPHSHGTDGFFAALMERTA